MALPKDAVIALRELFGDQDVLTHAADCWPYGYDNSRRHALPEAVVFANRHAQVVNLVRICNDRAIALTARGRGTGTTGATVPTAGGIVLSLERMTRIGPVDSANRKVDVEPGATNQTLQNEAGRHGFFWPPDPTSAAYCSIGGNLGYNSAGPRALKYGTPRENTLALRAVTGDGREIRTGAQTSKGVVGYDLTRLLIGSEGTLAIITEATLKLTPLPQGKRTMQAVYDDMHSAAAAVSGIMAQPVIPCTLEFIDGAAIDMVRDYAKTELPHGAGAMLMIEVDGMQSELDEAARHVAEAAGNPGLLSLQVAAGQAEVAALWETRKALSPALRNVAPKKINEDVVVPVSAMAQLIDGLRQLSQRFGIPIVNFGHAGNGNIHVNLLIDPANPTQMSNAEHCLSETFDLVLGLNGSLSGEHGVGLEKRDFVPREIDADTLGLMHRIKRQFDPKGILNPGKKLPEI